MWKWIAEGVVTGNSFWTDSIGDLISYVFTSTSWADRIMAIAHNAKAFDLLFLLNRLVGMKNRQAEGNVPESGKKSSGWTASII
jgi:hypothetical protein